MIIYIYNDYIYIYKTIEISPKHLENVKSRVHCAERLSNISI